MNNLTLEGFLGIPFGSTLEVAKEKMASRGAILNIEDSNTDNLFYNNLSFAGRQTEMILLLFHEQQFTKACVTLNLT